MFNFFASSFSALKRALSKTSTLLSQKITRLFKGPFSDKMCEELEEILFEADIGSACAFEFVDSARRYFTLGNEVSPSEILKFFHAKTLEILSQAEPLSPKIEDHPAPHVIVVMGVNGSGKTTSIAKLSYALKKQGKKVLLAAGDTFRAAATEQLRTWAERIGVELISSSPGADPAAVAYDALVAAKHRGYDVLLIDTAGRLQTKTELMQELKKIKQVLHKQLPGAPHETLLVLDATTGQNGIDQVEVFHSFTPLTGLILTKLDGTAKGGVVLAICKKWKIPLAWIGTGEGLEDFTRFDSLAFANALFSPLDETK